jgi:2-succinyl-6-hydroxy-2,4-cyclohexadiene-1-carboxylate synthase
MLFSKSFGNPQKPLVLLLHGFLGCGDDFLPLIEHLPEDFFYFIPDLPAHGNSPYTPHLLPQLLSSLPQKPLFLIGYSLGGRLAMQMSSSFEDSAVIAISSHPGLSSIQAKESRFEEDLFWKKQLETLSPREFLTLWYQRPIFSSLQQKPKLLAELIEKRTYTNGQEKAQVLEDLSLAKQPLFSKEAFFLYGEQDLAYKKLYANLCHVFSIPDAGHTILLENPEACANAITICLKKKMEGFFP